MRFRLFLVTFLVYGLITFVSCNENVVTESEESEKVEKIQNDVDFVEVSKNTVKPKIIEKSATSRKAKLAPTTAKTVSSVVVFDPLRNLTQLPQRSGKLVRMELDDYMGELVDVYGDNGYNWNDLNNRVAPPGTASHVTVGGYVISSSRLAEIRSYFMYWYFDQDMYGGRGDYQFDIHASMTQVHKNFNFQLPFFGFRFNYTRISLNGYLEFSDPPEYYTYPLVFPVVDWPKRNDPSFIGIFFSKCRVGRIYGTDIDQRTPGVYFRMERDLMTRTDRFGVEVRERTMWDIREGVVGADTFVPKHVVIATWKNVSFAGGIDNSLFTTNTFQMVLATDEVYTYAIFNYDLITWSAHTEAGGDTTHGEGGVPAFIGFNAGNGTQSYEYKPYSQAMVLRDLTGRGWGNGFPGRHIFRIDERILIGSCNKDIDDSHLPLTFAPESGNMLGGTVVNVTGPCFDPNQRVTCHFDTESVLGHYVNKNRVICVQPFLKAEGYVRFEISVGNKRYKWRGKYFVETPAASTERVFFEFNDVHQKAPKEIHISWDRYNLTSNFKAEVTISLWGYRETTIYPQLEYIDVIQTLSTNTGNYTIVPSDYIYRNNINNDLQFGFLQINLTNPQQYSGLKISPILWSRPIPLAWYFGPQWERKYGRHWPRSLCDNWLRTDRYLRNFAADLPLCPCTLDQAIYDKGRYMPDRHCDKDSNPTCLRHKGAIHCVVSGTPTPQGAEQQCCYDRYGSLMLTYDQMWGSRPRRNHNLGKMPWNEAGKVPTLSSWFHDRRPFYSCCLWQQEQAVGCETYRFERRPSQDCVAYQAPGVAGVFGDPHFITFDGTPYTFNGLGEFVLARSVDADQRFEVQGRFEQMPRNMHGPVAATQLTALAMRGNTTTTIEVRSRPLHARWRYRLDVLADGKRIYFDRESLKFQHFDGVTVYTPTYLLNQSQVIVMFDAGIGVEVIENEGFITGRVYLPWGFINKTAGLFGNWSFNPLDDFTLPDMTVIPNLNPDNMRDVAQRFGMKWMLTGRDEPGVGRALFTRDFGGLASYFANTSFVPNYLKEPSQFLPANRSYDVERAEELCGKNYQCQYDYGMTLDRNLAHFTKIYYDTLVNIRDLNSRRVLSCGVLETPRFGRKDTFCFTPGCKVSFACNEGFVLMGDQRRECMANGLWNVPEYGYTVCLREVYYTRRVAFIAIGIILLVILPLMLCIVCGVYRFRQKQLKEDPHWQMPVLPRSRSSSRSNLRQLSQGADDDSDTDATHTGTLKKTKKWDLDDEDVTSSEGSERKDTRVAKDIEYINTAGERVGGPKQLGRRSLRSASELNGIGEQEHGDHDAEPEVDENEMHDIPADQQQLTQYSPTYSGHESPHSSSLNAPPPQNRFGGVPVLPNNNTHFFSRPTSFMPAGATPMRSTSPTLPPLTQENGLPSPPHAASPTPSIQKSTEV